MEAAFCGAACPLTAVAAVPAQNPSFGSNNNKGLKRRRDIGESKENDEAAAGECGGGRSGGTPQGGRGTAQEGKEERLMEKLLRRANAY